MMAMLTHIIEWLDMIILPVGKKRYLVTLIMFLEIRLGYIINPTSPANFLKMCHDVIVLICYHSLYNSSITKRLCGVAVLSLIALHLWTLSSMVPLSYQLCFLLCIIYLEFLSSVEDNLKFMFKFVIPLIKLYNWTWLWLRNVAHLVKIGCHFLSIQFVVVLSYLPSFLSRIIGLLDVMLCSVGKNAERMNRYLKFLNIKVVFDIPKLYELWLKSSGLANYLKVICYGGFLILLCYLGMLNNSSINHRLFGVVFLSSFGYLLWSSSTTLLFWSRVCFVGVSDLFLAGLATAYEYRHVWIRGN